MLPIRTIDSPAVVEGDASSYLARARGNLDQRRLTCDQRLLEADCRQAMALAPEDWQPWEILAQAGLATDNERVLLYDEAILRGADRTSRWERALLLEKLGRLPEAERDYTHLVDRFGDRMARDRRSGVRTLLEDFHGAIADLLAPDQVMAAFHVRERLGRLYWMVGDLAQAYNAFAAPVIHNGSEEQFRVWTCLCELAHGKMMPLPDAGQGPPTDTAWRGVVVASRHRAWPAWLVDPASPPSVWFWDLIDAMFLGRIAPAAVLSLAEPAVLESDKHARSLEIPPGVDPGHLQVPVGLVWQAEVRFYCGMALLAGGDARSAASLLEEAAAECRSGAQEHLAARAQLKRLRASQGRVAHPGTLRLADLPADHVVRRFAGLTMDEVRQRKHPADLDFTQQGLGDEGARLIAASPNLAAIMRLSLHTNGLSSEGAAALARSAHVAAIFDLGLEANPIGDEGLIALLNSESLASLRILRLHRTSLTRKGLEALAGPHRLQLLERVDLGEDPIPIDLWRTLARRYGNGLYAAGRLDTDAVPPLDHRLEACISCSPELLKRCYEGAMSLGPSLCPPEVSSQLYFRLADHVAFRIEKATADAWRPRDRRHQPIPGILAAIDDLEAQSLQATETVHVEHLVGFDMIEHYRPLRLVCSACPAPWEDPVILRSAPMYSAMRRYTCPAGHDLFHR